MTLPLFRSERKCIPLRPYQALALEAVHKNLWDDGNRSTLVVMATGLGKTVLFSTIAQQHDGSVLVIAHRKTLLEQARATLREITGEDVGLEQGSNRTCGQRIVVASKDSLHLDRIERDFPRDRFSLIIVDEAHRSVSASYTHIFDRFSAAKIIGVTATPNRADEKALGAVFESVSYVYEIADGIADGWLVPLRMRRIHLAQVDLKKISTVAGDLNQGELDEEMQRGNEGVASETLEHAKGLRTIVFTTTVENAAILAKTFNKLQPGCAQYISGDMDELTKASVIKSHKSGRFQVLVNVDVLTEGYDDPGVQVVAMAKPTKSQSRYAQSIGRGTRALKGVIDGIESADDRVKAIGESAKPFCLILDFVGNSERNDLIGPEDILGGTYDLDTVAEVKRRTAGEEYSPSDELSTVAKERRLMREAKARSVDGYKAVSIKSQTEDVDPFARLGARAPNDWQDRFATSATPKQLEALKKAGVKAPSGLTSSQASRLLKKVADRRAKGLATLKQLDRLASYGFTGLDDTLTFKVANRAFKVIEQCNWRPPFPPKMVNYLNGLRNKT